MAVLPFEFEKIYMKNNSEVNRSKVPGGWLVTIVANAPRAQLMTTTFITDPNHEWEVE